MIVITYFELVSTNMFIIVIKFIGIVLICNIYRAEMTVN